MLSGEEAGWPTITELVNYALSDDDPTGGEFSARLRQAQAADPDAGREIFLQLLRNPLRRVREYAVSAGPVYGGAAVASALPEMLADRAWSVQELAMQSLSEAAPELLRQHVPTLRRKFREWRRRDDNDPLIHLAWTAVKLDIADLAPEIADIAQDEAFAPADRSQALIWITYLKQGPSEILRRIGEHDHENMLHLCRLAWMKGLSGARAAYERCASKVPEDDSCRMRCGRFAAAAGKAEAAGEPMTSRNRPE